MTSQVLFMFEASRVWSFPIDHRKFQKLWLFTWYEKIDELAYKHKQSLIAWGLSENTIMTISPITSYSHSALRKWEIIIETFILFWKKDLLHIGKWEISDIIVRKNYFQLMISCEKEVIRLVYIYLPTYLVLKACTTAAMQPLLTDLFVFYVSTPHHWRLPSSRPNLLGLVKYLC